MINSKQNELYKKIKALKNKKNRDESNVFIAEGYRFVNEIPSDWEIELFAVSESFSSNNELGAYESKARVFIFKDNLFEDLCDTSTPQGILAICNQKNYDYKNILNSTCRNDFFIICENLNDPGNLGTIIRTADACNAKAVILSTGCVDVYNNKVLRSTMGSIFHLPIIKNVDISELIEELKSLNISITSTCLTGSVDVYDAELNKKCAIFIGNEARGISNNVIENSDCLVKIPMPGKAESFNASVAAGIIMYEAVRQRNKMLKN